MGKIASHLSQPKPVVAMMELERGEIGAWSGEDGVRGEGWMR